MTKGQKRSNLLTRWLHVPFFMSLLAVDTTLTTMLLSEVARLIVSTGQAEIHMLNTSGLWRFNEIWMSSVFKDTPETISEFLGQRLPMGWARQILLSRVPRVVGPWGPALPSPNQGLMATDWAEIGFLARAQSGGRLWVNLSKMQ